MLYGALVFAALAFGLCKAVGVVDGIYDTLYRRELYLKEKVRRELEEEKRDALARIKNPEWEPVQDETGTGEDTE
ncbi:MAG: hypothetical protein IJT94_16880 [Oscillibacter sp.]|nr:hypothetical protein [Oscillibacter sp.]